MTTPSSTVSNANSSKRRGIFRKRNSSSKRKSEKRDDAQRVRDDAQDSLSVATPMPDAQQVMQARSSIPNANPKRGRDQVAPPPPSRGRRDESHRYSSLDDEAVTTDETPLSSNPKPPRPGIVQRIRSASRSRSRSRSRKTSQESEGGVQPILVAVTSCRSDAYYNQKAPGSTSKLPRKAPSNLKLFHELAVGVKDAYAAVGETPTRPDEDNGGEQESSNSKLSPIEFEGRMVLWEFMGNIDFLLALVDEVAIDTATRGALKDDTTFKCLRDVIKKCNKILEGMLVRRERRYTLFIQLVQPTETKDIAAMKAWNAKVEKAVGAVADGSGRILTDENETASITSGSTNTSSTSGRSGMFSRGRQLLPSAGRVRARRATPTPALRKKRGKQNAGAPAPDAVAAEDGYSAVTAPVTSGNLAMLQRSLAVNNEISPQESKMGMPPAPVQPKQQLAPVKPMEPKDELVDVIRGLHVEKMNRTKEGASSSSSADNDLATLKPNWQPKADIPTSVPKLPIEYIHRHRLMKQVVSCLLERSGAGPRDTDEEVTTNAFITSITSRHGDKPGNGKTTLAVAAIQTVEVRERFADGIAWVQLGRKPLSEKDIRRLYEELYRQLVMKDDNDEADDDDDASSKSSDKPLSRQSSFASLDKLEKENDNKESKSVRYSIFGQLAESRRRFHSGDLDGIKEDLGRILSRKKVLICLDDVWRVEDAKWFIFDTKEPESGPTPPNRRNFPTAADEPHPYRILLTTRTPALLGAGVVQEVFVRIFSEPEAVKLLLSSAGRRPYGGKNSAVFHQARVIVKGCGNSPLAVRLAGGMLRRSNRNWNLSSPTWTALMQQCKLNLDEASRLRSFINSASRVVDLSFMTVEEAAVRAALRRCFVIFAMAFHDNDWVLLGRGIPQPVVLKLFGTVMAAEQKEVSPNTILSMLEAMNLLERARHGCSYSTSVATNDDDSPNTSMDDDPANDDSLRDFSKSRHSSRSRAVVLETPSFVMQDSIKAIAEEMARRHTPSFLPSPDEFTSFTAEIEEEQKVLKAGSVWSAPWRYLTSQLSSNNTNGQGQGMEERQVHELVVASMLGIRGSVLQAAIADAYAESRSWTMVVKGGDKVEEYMGAFVPTHLIQAEAYSCAVDLLVDPHFISRRVAALGAIEATRRHVADLLELRRVVGKSPPVASSSPKKSSRRGSADAAAGDPAAPGSPAHGHDPPLTPHSPESPGDSTAPPEVANIDAVAVMREGSRRVIDEVYRVANASAGSSDSLTMAICLSSVGEGLLKCRQPRDAMLRLEEAVGIYRGLLGPFHIEVARSLHSVAKALVKLGETRVALLKFGEAARIYESCNATLHFDSIANAQNMASLLVELGEWGKAEEKFEEVISMKKAVYGEANASVAKAINSYAILLAKHGRMDEALKHYEDSKATYAAVQPSAVRDPEFELKCTYDVTLINLNIASIKSKKGDLQGAIDSYEEGVRGLREHEEAQKALELSTGDIGKSHSHNKHLVAALGRIGSLKLKLGDIEGALEMYVTLLNEVDDNSPTASRTEKAKAHIKCATIYRQLEGKDAHIKSISHLREALEMYTMLFGPEHKDTQAIASSLRQWLSEDQS